jgi:hypothetical protein
MYIKKKKKKKKKKKMYIIKGTPITGTARISLQPTPVFLDQPRTPEVPTPPKGVPNRTDGGNQSDHCGNGVDEW